MIMQQLVESKLILLVCPFICNSRPALLISNPPSFSPCLPMFSHYHLVLHSLPQC